jgi:hypothetical protein
LVFPLPSAIEIKGVIPIEIPIPNIIKTKKILFPKEAAANGKAPNRPTIILSATPTDTCPSWLSITG